MVFRPDAGCTIKFAKGVAVDKLVDHRMLLVGAPQDNWANGVYFAMGVLTDFVAVKRDEAEIVCQSLNPSKDFAGIDAKGIDTVKMGTLYAILMGVKADPAFMSDFVCQASEDGPWVSEVPQDMARKLAELAPTELRSIGARWATTEEFTMEYGGWPPEAVHQVLQNLAMMCTRALSESKVVFMWMCL